MHWDGLGGALFGEGGVRGKGSDWGDDWDELVLFCGGRVMASVVSWF